MNIIDGGVTVAKGFKASGIAANIKRPGRRDMALVYSEVPAICAGTFTTNKVKAAPVKRDINIIENTESVQAVVINTGYANACTGEQGDKDNELMAEYVAKELGISSDAVLTCSTGIIGMHLPMEPVKNGAVLLKKELSDTLEAGSNAAEAIMTTDTVSKEIAVTLTLSGKKVVIGGMSKGSGMIHPNMATMLGVITTDAAISKTMLNKAIKADIKDSFNMISVDRDTSTNDSLIIFANGQAENPVITDANDDYKAFCKALSVVTQSLAKMMAGDGEGASKLIEVCVKGAASKPQAVGLSKSVISSNLVKAAIFGSDANWGRILCAMGYSGEDFNPDTVDVFINSDAGQQQLAKDGMAAAFSEELAKKILSAKEVNITINLHLGDDMATAWGCDLTYDYVKINGDYRS